MSVRTSVRVDDATAADWAARFASGETLRSITLSSGHTVDTVRKHLRRAGFETDANQPNRMMSASPVPAVKRYKVVVSVYLRCDQDAALRVLALGTGVSMSRHLRAAVDQYLASQS